jgi:hypothetical protein
MVVAMAGAAASTAKAPATPAVISLMLVVIVIVLAPLGGLFGKSSKKYSNRNNWLFGKVASDSFIFLIKSQTKSGFSYETKGHDDVTILR